MSQMSQSFGEEKPKNDRKDEAVWVARFIAGEIIVFDISTYLKGLIEFIGKHLLGVHSIDKDLSE